MAITHRTFVLLVFPLCCGSIAILITSLATEEWFTATSKYTQINKTNNINYGLFGGTHVINLLDTPKHNNLYITCLSDLGVCHMSCLADKTASQDQLRALYNGEVTTNECDPSSAFFKKSEKYYHYHMQKSDLQRGNAAGTFISYGLWVSTVVFISLSILMASIGALFAVINTAGNPVEPILGIFGLYVWNISSVVMIVITMAIWGVQYEVTLKDNAAIYETIIGETSSQGGGGLGSSYWILFGPIALHLTCIGMLLYRRHLIRTTPPAPTVRLEEDPDGAIFLY